MRSNNATKNSADAVEVIKASAINRKTKAAADTRPTVHCRIIFFLTGRTVSAFESLTTEAREKTTNDKKVVVNANPKIEIRFTSGLTNTALNNDVKVPLITGDSQDAA